MYSCPRIISSRSREKQRSKQKQMQTDSEKRRENFQRSWSSLQPYRSMLLDRVLRDEWFAGFLQRESRTGDVDPKHQYRFVLYKWRGRQLWLRRNRIQGELHPVC